MNVDAMLSAVEEVASVAEELRGLREKIKQYGDASRRVGELGDALKDVASSVTRMQGAFSGALELAQKSQEHADAGKKAIQALVDSIPDVVSRIESSDVYPAIQSFTGSMDKLGQLLQKHKESLSIVVTRFEEASAEQSTSLAELTQRVDRGLSSITRITEGVQGLHEASLQNKKQLNSLNDTVCDDVAPNIRATKGAVTEVKVLLSAVHGVANKSADGMVEFSVKMLQEITTLRNGLTEANKALGNQGLIMQRQGELLDELTKKKKGWFS